MLLLQNALEMNLSCSFLYTFSTFPTSAITAPGGADLLQGLSAQRGGAASSAGHTNIT